MDGKGMYTSAGAYLQFKKLRLILHAVSYCPVV
jgi:hypothetical protein